MPGKSSSSAGASYLDREARVEELRRAARRAAGALPAVRRIYLFGSLVAGRPTPRSDADLLVEVSESPRAEPRDRIPELLGALSPLPCPVDLFVLTSAEIERFRAEGAPVIEAALRDGLNLLAPVAR